MTLELFKDMGRVGPEVQELGEGAVVLRGFALSSDVGMAEEVLLEDLAAVVAAAPFRRMMTPGGHVMSVAMTNCGALGWVTDKCGYRYQSTDPESGRAWPVMPASFLGLAARAAARAGYDGFVPDACLINRYEVGAKMSLHQDKNERDFGQPIVSVSLGIGAVFLFGGMERSDAQQRVPLQHGDVVVWGGTSRLRYHGVLALKEAEHAVLGRYRINLTFRKAG